MNLLVALIQTFDWPTGEDWHIRYSFTRTLIRSVTATVIVLFCMKKETDRGRERETETE